MIESEQRASQGRLASRVHGLETRINNFFIGHKNTDVALEWIGSGSDSGSELLKKAVTRGVSLAVAAQSPDDFITVIRGELGRKRDSVFPNAKGIFDPKIVEDAARVKRYNASLPAYYTDATVADHPVSRSEEVAVGKSVVRQLESLMETKRFDRIEIAVLLTQLHLLSQGQFLGSLQNLKARMENFSHYAELAVDRLTAEERKPQPRTDTVVYRRPNPETERSSEQIIRRIEDLVGSPTADARVYPTLSSRTIDTVLENIDDTLEDFAH